MKRMIETLSEAQQERIIAAFDEVQPRVLPSNWRASADVFAQARCYLVSTTTGTLKVIFEAELQDESIWLHVSVSRDARVPSYADLKSVKDVLIGRERKAIMVLPKESEHYNYHKHCLHLFSPYDADPLPDFRDPGGRL